jgi:hypothetical protein
VFKTSDIFLKYPYPKPDMFWHWGKIIKIKMTKTLNPNYTLTMPPYGLLRLCVANCITIVSQWHLFFPTFVVDVALKLT